MTAIEITTRFTDMSSIMEAFAYRLTQNREEAKDLYQETLFKVLRYKDKYREDTNFKAWSMTIMKNTFINNYRKKARQNTIIDQTEDDFYINSGEVSTENAGDANILLQELMKMVQSLENALRVPFLMHYQGYKYKEIAEELKLPIGTVKSRIFFARKQLKVFIDDKYPGIWN